MKNPFGRLSLVILSLLLFFCVSKISAQDLDDVTISGKITDSNGLAVVGAAVAATQVDSDVERTITTDDEGRYRIIELKPGLYRVRAWATGFGPQEKIGLQTISGQNVQLDFRLTPADIAASTNVTVSEEDAPAVDITRTIVGGTVTQREIEELPNSTRNPLDFVFTLGGVTEEPLSTRDLAEDRAAGTNTNNDPRPTPLESGIFSLSGGAAYSNNITIDGLDNNDDRLAQDRFQPSIDSIAEVQVITNQFSSEYGRASGGRVNIRTRAGSKNFRGRAYLYFRDESLNANTYYNNSRIPGLERLPFSEYNPGFTLSGPIPLVYFKNRTFFFTGYEYNNLSDTTRIDTIVPVGQNPNFALPVSTGGPQRSEAPTNTTSPAFVAPFVAIVPTPSRNHNFSARLDHNFTDNHSLTFNYEFGRRRNARQFRNATSRLEEAIQGPSRNTDAYKFTDNYVFNAKVVNQFRFQYSVFEPNFASANPNDPVILITLVDNLSTPTADRRSGTLITGNSTAVTNFNFPGTRKEVRYQFQDTLNAVIDRHTLKFGVDAQRIKSDTLDLRDATGTYSFFSVSSFINNRVERFRRNFGTESNQENTYYGLFVQDEWRVRPNVTLSLGLRYENESIIDDNNNFGPRAAIAYAPFKDNKGVIRVGAGIFYNRVLLRTVDDFTFNTQRVLGNFDSNVLAGPASGSSIDCFTNPNEPSPRCAFLRLVSTGFPTAPTRDEIMAIPGAAAGFVNPADNASNQQRRIDPTLQVPESYQFNVGFEREIGEGFVFETNYTYNKTIRLFREFNINGFRLPGGFTDFNDFLVRSFTTGNLRFVNGGANDTSGVSTVGGITTVNLATSNRSVTATSPIGRARTALASRPETARPLPNINDSIEQVASIGTSQYNGLIVEMRRRTRRLGLGFSASFRGVYTLSKLTDDGNNNTTNAQFEADFPGELSRALQDRRHRFSFSGTFDLPKHLLGLRVSPILRLGSSAPFNIGTGVDRNLNNSSTDRPDFTGDLSILRFRNPGDPIDPALATSFSLPLIGRGGGNLPRNAGRGPNLFIFDMNFSREIRFTDRFRLRLNAEINNILNSRVFSFGSEFIDFENVGTAAFEQEFLIPTRTYRPRQIRLGMRFDF